VLFAPFPEEGSVQTAPLFNVTSPLNIIARAVVLVEAIRILPEMLVAPNMVMARDKLKIAPLLIVNAPNVVPFTLFVVMLSIAPELMVTEPADVCTTAAVKLTEDVPVVAMITASPVAGITPPTQVVVVFQAPPAVVDVMVAAFDCLETKKAQKKIKRMVAGNLLLNEKEFSFFADVNEM